MGLLHDHWLSFCLFISSVPLSHIHVYGYKYTQKETRNLVTKQQVFVIFTLRDAENSLKGTEEQVRRGNGRSLISVFFSYKKGWSPFCSYKFLFLYSPKQNVNLSVSHQIRVVNLTKWNSCKQLWLIVFSSPPGPNERFSVVRSLPTPLAVARAWCHQWSTAPAAATSETWP